MVFFESAIREITQIIHDNGGTDGANMNAQVGLTNLQLSALMYVT
jgi:glycine dehydrogenase